jgi:amidase
VLIASETFIILERGVREALLAHVIDALGRPPGVELTPVESQLTIEDLSLVVRDVQGPEFAAVHGAWIEERQPTFLPAVAPRIEHALAVTPEAHARATATRDELRSHLAGEVREGDVVVVALAGRPTTRDADDAEYAEHRRLAASLSAVGSLAGLPTVAVPAVVVDGTPVGLGFLGAPGSDGLLLSLAAGRPPVRPATRPAGA